MFGLINVILAIIVIVLSKIIFGNLKKLRWKGYDVKSLYVSSFFFIVVLYSIVLVMVITA